MCKYDIQLPDEVDLCGAPGEFCQVLLSKGVKVITVSLNDCYYDNVKKSKNVKRIIGDVDDVVIDGMYSLIVADGANEFSCL